MPVLLGAAAVLLAAGCGENGTGPAQIKKGLEDEGGERIVFAGSLEGENEEKAREIAEQSIVRLEVKSAAPAPFISAAVSCGMGMRSSLS